MATIEELQDEILKLKEDNKIKDEKIATLTSDNEKYKEHNIKLQEHNNKLFSRITQREEQHEENENKPQTEDDLVAEIVKMALGGE